MTDTSTREEASCALEIRVPSPTHAHDASGERARKRARAADIDASFAEQMRVLGGLKADLDAHHRAVEDPELMLVLAEDETSLIEVLDLMLAADLNDDALIRGLKISKDTMAARLHRLEERRQSRRAILGQALRLLELRSLERPTATITLSERAPSLVVEEEAQIPARFFDLKPLPQSAPGEGGVGGR